MNTKVYRGAILRATSGPTNGHYYLLVRTMSGRDKHVDFLGNGMAGAYCPVRYTFNLVNIADVGKVRQTEVDRQFITGLDGVDRALNLSSLESHYNMTLEDVTSVSEIKVEMKELLDEKREEAKTIDMATILLSLFAGNVSFRETPDGILIVNM